uniref:Epoxyqueuosine reductase n=1 Tax=Myoviridae sp. ctk251 TaxID=2826689 RepID=A0A8S5MT49_9CAUD|nr:MAG TPA: epoxyqueuosine reductase [Myoviridae sp. ctk251]
MKINKKVIDLHLPLFLLHNCCTKCCPYLISSLENIDITALLIGIFGFEPNFFNHY